MKLYMVGRSACVCAAILMTASWASAAEPEAGWRQELAELRSRVAEQSETLRVQGEELRALRGERDASWLDERKAEQVKALVHEVLSDAELRASFREGGLTAGYDNGFFLRSEDDSFLLNICGLIQTRYMFSSSDAPVDGDDEPIDHNRGGFELSRTRLGLKGHVVDPSWTFVIHTGHNRSGNGFLDYGYVTKDLGNSLSVTAGQFKLPIWREWLVSSSRCQFVERSLLTAEFAGGDSQGVALSYRGRQARLTAALTDGLNKAGSAWTTEDVEGLALSARVELLAVGTSWGEYVDYESEPGDERSLVFGLAAHYQQGEYGTQTDESEITMWVADASLELGGGNVAVAVVGRHIRDVAGTDSQNQLGLLIQGGVFVTDDLELVARYEWGDLDMVDVDELSILTVGVNKFFDGHRVKFTGDVGYAFKAVDSDWASTGTGWRGEAAGSHGQIVVRSQVQLAF